MSPVGHWRAPDGARDRYQNLLSHSCLFWGEQGAESSGTAPHPPPDPAPDPGRAPNPPPSPQNSMLNPKVGRSPAPSMGRIRSGKAGSSV
jgi:hypothetical protein